MSEQHPEALGDERVRVALSVVEWQIIVDALTSAVDAHRTDACTVAGRTILRHIVHNIRAQVGLQSK